MSTRERARVAIVTGAASGIGRSIAAELVDRGWTVAGLDQTPRDGSNAYQLDVTDLDSVRGAVTKIEADLGPVEAVVSAAGHYSTEPIDLITAEQWNRMLRVHLGGLVNLASAVVPSMVERRSGAIVAVTSELAIGGGDGGSHYAAAKGAIIGFVRSLALELAPHGVRVNGLAPGPTDTPLLSADSPWRAPEYLATLPIGRLAKPAEIALVAAHLVEEATFTTGEVISPNSGAVI